MKKSILLSLLLVFGAILLAACGSSNNTSGDSKSSSEQNTAENSETVPASTEAEKLVVQVGTSPTYPPFESEVNGELVGFDIGLIKKIGEIEGFDVEFSMMQFDGLIPALKSGQIDVVVGALSITKSRMDSVNFSNAYYESGLSILTNPDSGITGFDDLKDKLIGIQKGTSSYNYMVDNGIADSNIKQYADIATAYIALENGSVDAILYDHPSNINYMQTQETKAQIVGDILAGEHYGIAVNKDKADILQKINDGLAKLQENGEYEKLFEEYLSGEKNGSVDGVVKPEDVVIDR